MRLATTRSVEAMIQGMGDEDQVEPPPDAMAAKGHTADTNRLRRLLRHRTARLIVAATVLGAFAILTAAAVSYGASEKPRARARPLPHIPAIRHR
jgi:hypothetical protein